MSITTETANISFFKIDRCGYYKGRSPSPVFGSVSDLLSQLQGWTRGKALAQTQTFQNVVSSTGETLLPVYLYDIKNIGTDWLLILWNQIPATDGQVASVMANGSVGQAQVHMNDVRPGSIPGYATYFWFRHSANVFASIRFQHASAGHAALQSYLLGYLEKFSDHVVYEDSAAGSGIDIAVQGYRANAQDAAGKFNPRFRSSVFTKPGEHELLIREAHKINKIVRRTQLELQTAEDLALWQHLWRKMFNSGRSQPTDPVSVSYELKARLTANEVRHIIDEHQGQDDESSWDDVGFQLTGESSPRWLNKSYARDKFKLDIERENAEIVKTTSLFQAIESNKTAILGLLS